MTRGDLDGVKRRLAKGLMAIAGVYKVLKWSKLVTDGAKVVLKIWVVCGCLCDEIGASRM